MKTLKGKIVAVLAGLLLVGAAFALGTGVHLVANSTSKLLPTIFSITNPMHINSGSDISVLKTVILFPNNLFLFLT